MNKINWIILKSKDRGIDYGVGTFIKQLSNGLAKHKQCNVFIIETGITRNKLFSVKQKDGITFIQVDFPIHSPSWKNSLQILRNQTLPFEYVFNVSSLSDSQKLEQLVEQFRIERYQLKPVFTGDNMHFFKENVFLSKEDILSSHISLRNIFSNQSINIFDFGKINIMPNGDVFSNLNHPSLGNIYTSSIYNLVRKELIDGKSWLRTRNIAPCDKCVYQWLCPSPSEYEIAIGRPNLCNVIKQ